jgi:hypothetical protein
MTAGAHVGMRLFRAQRKRRQHVGAQIDGEYLDYG